MTCRCSTQIALTRYPGWRSICNGENWRWCQIGVRTTKTAVRRRGRDEKWRANQEAGGAVVGECFMTLMWPAPIGVRDWSTLGNLLLCVAEQGNGCQCLPLSSQALKQHSNNTSVPANIGPPHLQGFWYYLTSGQRRNCFKVFLIVLNSHLPRYTNLMNRRFLVSSLIINCNSSHFQIDWIFQILNTTLNNVELLF